MRYREFEQLKMVRNDAGLVKMSDLTDYIEWVFNFTASFGWYELVKQSCNSWKGGNGK
jgi:hypothetical protein